MKHKGRTIGIIILCVVVVLLVINWQVQPLHKLRPEDTTLTFVHIVRSDVNTDTTVEVRDPQALQALQDSARRAVPLCIGLDSSYYMLDDGAIYYVSVFAGDTCLTHMTVDSKGFLDTQYVRYHVLGTSWRDAVEATFQKGTVVETHEKWGNSNET